MKVSILIPTYNAGKEIETMLNMLYKQQINDGEFEVIIVDSSSTDNTVEIIQKNFPKTKVEVIPNKEFDHGGTRNLLYRLSSGEFLLFMTQDAVPADEFLIKNLVESFTNPKVLISYARQIPKRDANPLEVFARQYNYPSDSIIKDKDSIKSLGIKAFFNSNVCSMYKKEVFEKFSGFPEKIILNEDLLLASEIILQDYCVLYNSNAVVYHSHNYSYKQQFKRYFDIGMAFDETRHLLNIVSNEKEGIKMVLTQIKYLSANQNKKLIPKSIIESAIKLISYNLGKKHAFLPNGVKKVFSAYMK